MIRPEELMIGNYVQDQDETIGVVYRIYPNVIDVHAEDIGLVSFATMEQIKPIPITEQWLLGLGFKHYHEYEKTNLILYISGFKFEYNTYGKWLRLNSKEVNIKYIHQLQNLYYLLTGEQLKKKDTN